MLITCRYISKRTSFAAPVWVSSTLLGLRTGDLVHDNFAGYKAGLEKGITKIRCMARARSNFFALPVANKSQLAKRALHSIDGLSEVEHQTRDISDEKRWRIR